MRCFSFRKEIGISYLGKSPFDLTDVHCRIDAVSNIHHNVCAFYLKEPSLPCSSPLFAVWHVAYPMIPGQTIDFDFGTCGAVDKIAERFSFAGGVIHAFLFGPEKTTLFLINKAFDFACVLVESSSR